MKTDISLTETNKNRSYIVAKSNDLIRRSRAGLTLGAQRVLNFSISKIRPDVTEMPSISFSIQEFLRTFGLNDTSGENYKHVKAWCQQLRDKSWYYKPNDNEEVTMSWITKVHFKKKQGMVTLDFDPDMAPFLLELKKTGNFTQYELSITIYFKYSTTGILYDLLRSYAFSYSNRMQKEFEVIESLDHLKYMYDAQDMETKRFMARYINKAVEDLNRASDFNVSVSSIKKGRVITQLKFSMTMIDAMELMKRQCLCRAEDAGVDTKHEIPGQLNLFSPIGEIESMPLSDYLEKCNKE